MMKGILFVFILTIFTIGLTNAWILPKPEFVLEFMKIHNRNSIIYHLPPLNQDFYQIHALTRTFRSNGIFCQFLEQNSHKKNFQLLKEDLHVFIFDPVNQNESIQYLLDIFEERQNFDREFWLIDLSTLDNPKDQLANLPLDINDDIFWFLSNYDNIRIWESYKLDPKSDLILLDYGTWNEASGLKTVSQSSKWHKRQNLRGHHFTIATLESKPYTTGMIPIGNNSYIPLGLFPDVFYGLQEVLNFTFTCIKPPDGAWGAIQKDGSWNGMVALLASKKIDIAPTDFTVTEARSFVISFAQPITQIYHSLFILNPSETYNYRAYVETLHYMTWVVLALFVLLAPPVLYFTIRFEEKDEEIQELFTFSKSYIFIVNAILMKDWSATPKYIASRIAFASLVLFGFLIYYHWEAQLITNLSIRTIILPFRSIPELISKTDFKIALTPGTSYEDAFKTSTDPDWQMAWKTRTEPFLEKYETYTASNNLEEIMFAEENIAYYDNFFAVESKQLYIDCKIIAIPAKYDFKPYAYGFQKDSPWLDLFNFHLKEMREKGALKQIEDKYKTGPQVCPDLSGKPLGFENCFSAFGVLFFGAVFCALLFMIESVESFCRIK